MSPLGKEVLKIPGLVCLALANRSDSRQVVVFGKVEEWLQIISLSFTLHAGYGEGFRIQNLGKI